MSRNGSGTYTLPAGNPVVTGTTISSTWANSTLTNIASALTDSLAADGQTTATGNLKMGNNRVTGMADGIASTDAATVSQVTAAGATYLLKASNLSDVANAATSRTNLGLGTIATQAASAVAVTGGTINGTTVGATTAATGRFTTLEATGVTTVQAGTASDPAITTTGDTNTGIFFPSADTIAFSEGGAEAMRINASGDVGIGTASPQARFQVDSSSTTYSANIRARNSNFGSGIIGAASGILTVATDMNNLAFYTASNLGVDGTSAPTNERMRIDSSGRLLLNQTANNGTSLMQMISPTSADAILVQIGTNGNNAMSFLNAGGAANVGSIAVNLASTAYNTSSDYRLKENIAPMTGALATVAALKPVTYKWKVDGSDGQGFIAHELAEVVPDCVTGEKDAVETVDEFDKDGNKIGTKEMPRYQGIDTSFLVATLTAAIQELKATVDAQAARIAALEA